MKFYIWIINLIFFCSYYRQIATGPHGARLATHLAHWHPTTMWEIVMCLSTVFASADIRKKVENSLSILWHRSKVSACYGRVEPSHFHWRQSYIKPSPIFYFPMNLLKNEFLSIFSINLLPEHGVRISRRLIRRWNVDVEEMKRRWYVDETLAYRY